MSAPPPPTTGVLDPRLGGTPNTAPPPPPPQQQQQQHKFDHPPPPRFTGAGNAAYSQASPQPYYNYPTPQGHTPQQHGTTASTGSQSNQASPEGVPAYQQVTGADSGDEDGNATGQPGEDTKRPRACEACRGLKVRCDQDPQHPEIPCRRCQKAGRQCIITAPSRKRQKKADSRVAELEKKLDALTSVLQQHQAGQSGQYAAAPAPPAPDMMQGRHFQTPYPQHPHQHPPPAASPTTARPGSSHTQPPQKRRRTDEEESLETPTLDGYGESNAAPVARYAASQSQDAVNQQLRRVNEHWGGNADSMRNLIHRSPEEFTSRINTLVPPDLSVTIFNRYVHKLAPHMPAVVFPRGTTAEQLWKEKPILYVCILSAASSGTLHPDISKQLSREAIRAIADCVVCNGAKSLELIQAMQVLALWYKPPEKAEQTNFYQIIHMAAVMAIDIGLGKRFNATKARRGFGGPHADYAPGPQMILPQNSDTIEARRAWLGCYYLCASASMVLRRPNLLRWSNYMQECVDILESSSDGLSSDKLFCQHVKVQHICEDIGLQFLMDDNTATVSITDPKVTYALNVLENDLKTWSNNVPPENKDHLGLKFFEHVASLYLHEIALHFNHNIEDFRLPFTEESLKSVNNSSETLTQHQMAALEACRKAAHGILDTMLSLDIETVKSLPMLIYFVRCTYALVILIKMHVAITTPGSEISKIMTPEQVRVDHYLDNMMQMFSHVASEQEFRPHPKILRILAVLKEWFRKHKENVAAQARGEQIPHPQNPVSNDHGNGANGQPLNQTPLHMLSQVATANQQRQPGQEQDGNRDWTFNSPMPVPYDQRPPPGQPDNNFPIHQQQQGPQPYPGPADGNPAYTADPGQFGDMPPEYMWGSGFEQAMEINLGSMDGLSGNGMDGLFLGNGMAPFVFNGDVAAASGQW